MPRTKKPEDDFEIAPEILEEIEAAKTEAAENAATEAAGTEPAEVAVTDTATEEMLSKLLPEEPAPESEQPEKKEVEVISLISEKATTENEPIEETTARKPTKPEIPTNLPVITVEKDAEIVSDEDIAEETWHDIKDAYLTRRVMNGVLEGVEVTPNDGRIIGITYYNGFKIFIPAQELISFKNSHLSINNKTDIQKIASAMIGCEISYIILAIDNTSKLVVASRNRANEKNIETFYFTKNARGYYKIYPNSIVEARITGVSEYQIKVEVFGAETNILQRELSWDWIDDAREHFEIGDRVMVKITNITGRDDGEKDFSIQASVRLAIDNKQITLINSLMSGCTYMGTVTDIHKGVILIKLSNGANVMAHSSKARQPVCKGDTVSFIPRIVDKEAYTANGYITRIIKRAKY